MDQEQQPTGSESDQLSALLGRVDALEQRVEALAAAQTVSATPPAARVSAADSSTSPGDLFWALQGLKEREPEPGAVMIVGSVQAPGGASAQWQLGARTEELLDDEWESAAGVLDALGHLVRLRILKEVMNGRDTAKELARAEDMGSIGQVYHHLRILTAADWLRARAAGAHEIPAERLVPLLTCILGGRR